MFCVPGHDLQKILLQRKVPALTVGSGCQSARWRCWWWQLFGLPGPDQGPDEEERQDSQESRPKVCCTAGVRQQVL